MALNINTPGVYIQELPAMPGGITGVPTSVAAFVGATEAGPVNTPAFISSWASYQQQFGNLSWQAMVPWAVHAFFAEGGSCCWVVRAADAAQASAASLCTGPLTVHAASPGLWGNALHVMIGNAGSDSAPAATEAPVFSLSVLLDASISNDPAGPFALLHDYVQANGLAAQVIQGVGGAVDGKAWYLLERFNGLTSTNLAQQVAETVNAQSIFVRAKVAPPAAGTAPQRPPNGGPMPLAGGEVPQLDVVAATLALDTAETLSNFAQRISLLATPDTPLATAADGAASIAAQGSLVQSGLQYCQNLGNVFYVVDPPHGLDVPGVLAFKTGQGTAPGGNPTPLTSAFGALYYPWVFANHPQTGTSVPMPPSGTVLGRYAATDASVGVWSAPAGVSNGVLQSVTQLAYPLTDADQDTLNPQGINCLRHFNNYGNVIWGARTLSADLDWTYVSVRRLVIYVEQSLAASLQWTVFEVNGLPLWIRVTAEVNNFLSALWRDGGLVGPTATSAYGVTCNESNNTPQDILDGILNVTVMLAVTHPAEFLVLTLQLPTATP
jgi:phage tail sheath protein FI